tara:strand:+ start:252 stop:629 length:378 start_codon:yes stop_codon:yes gene_type:complete
MELKDFISKTLIEIYSGVNDAIREIDTNNLGGAINPMDTSHIQKVDLKDYASPLKFDIAVTTSDKDAGDFKGGIKVWSVEIGGSSASEKSNSEVTRVQFSVPMLLPITDIKTKTTNGVLVPSRKK